MTKNIRVFAILSGFLGITVKEQNPYTPGDSEEYTMEEYKKELKDEYDQSLSVATIVTLDELKSISSQYEKINKEPMPDVSALTNENVI
jgi:hypothetical protein